MTALQGLVRHHEINALDILYSIYSRTFDNYSVLTSGDSAKHEYWGLCKPECKGEMPAPDSEYNLARDNEVFNTAWSNGVYGLMQYQAGFCYTYDPPKKSGRGVSNGLYFMLGNKKLFQDYENMSRYISRDSSYLLYSFDIYLHEKVNICFALMIYTMYKSKYLGSILVKVRYGHFWSVGTNLCFPKL